MRQVAQVALQAYGLPQARLLFLRQAGNSLFRVYETNPAEITRPDLYLPGQYLLRIHQPGYQTRQAIELELLWLEAMCREAGLPVPEPVRTQDGSLLAGVSMPGISGERHCSLLRWLRGRALTKDFRPYHYRAQGELMAGMHAFAAKWPVPPGLTKRNYDWEGLFRDDLGGGMLASEAWALLPPDYLRTYEQIAAEAGQAMHGLGSHPGVYGLIHGDLGLDANILFWKGQARAIDFDDSGFGYYLYDLSLALDHCQDDPDLPRFRDALLDGYSQIRPIPDDHLNYLDLFLAAFHVYWSLWAATAAMRYPDHQEELFQRMGRYYNLVCRYAESH